MESKGNKMSYQGSSTRTSASKKWLIGIFSVLVALDVIRLIGTISLSKGSGIGFSLISLVLDGVLLAAIIKEWRVVLNIARIVIIIGIVLSIISVVVVGVAISRIGSFSHRELVPQESTETQKNVLIMYEVTLSVAILINIFLVVLLGRYTAELASASHA